MNLVRAIFEPLPAPVIVETPPQVVEKTVVVERTPAVVTAPVVTAPVVTTTQTVVTGVPKTVIVTGAEEFTLSIGNAVKGVKYQVYMTTSLSLPFEACGDVVEAEADGTLEFSVATGGAASAFFKVGCDSL